MVLLGDAAHTAHYSIGSGTKLAMEDAIALVEALDAADDLPGALTHVRGACAVRRSSGCRSWPAAASCGGSRSPSGCDLPVEQLMVAYMTRAGNVPLDRFAQSSPDVVRRALTDYAGTAPAATPPDADGVGARPATARRGPLASTPGGWTPGRSPPVADEDSAGPTVARVQVARGTPGRRRGRRRRARPAARRRRVRGFWLVGPPTTAPPC